MGARLQNLDSRVKTNEGNIVSAIYVANQAYNKASEMISVSTDASNKAQGALDTSNKILGSIESLENAVSQNQIMSETTKALLADEMVNTESLKKEFDAKVTEFDTALGNSALEMQKTKESIELMNHELRVDIDNAAGELKDLKKDLEPLATWPEGATGDETKGVAGFVAQAKENGAVLADIVLWKKGAGDESLAGFVSKATAENATVKALANYKYTDSSGKEYQSVAALHAYAKENEANINLITGIDGSLTGLRAQVDKNSASVATLASHVIGDYVTLETWDNAKATSGIVYYVEDTKQYYYYDNGWKNTDKPYNAGLTGALTGIQQTADANAANIEIMTSLTGDFGDALTGFVQNVTEENSEIKALASYGGISDDGKPYYGAAGIMGKVNKAQSDIEAIANREFVKNDGTIVKGLAGLNTYVNENESNVSLVANRVAGKYIIIPEPVEDDQRDPSKIYARKYNGIMTYRFYEEDRNEWGACTIWKDLISRSEKINQNNVYYICATKMYRYYDDNISGWYDTPDPYEAGLPAALGGLQVEIDQNSSSVNSFASWQSETNETMARIEQKADSRGAYIRSIVTNLDKYSVGPYSQAYGFTREQATEVLKEGMIYVPTSHVKLSAGTEYHTE
jgi:hypothetical protein